MEKYLASVAIGILLVTALVSCGTPTQDAALKTGKSGVPAPLSLAGLPAAGLLDLKALNSSQLDRLGLERPVHLIDPPYTPYNDNGFYWSEPFSLIEGDTLRITVDSDTPVSWFGVDWSNYDVRGILATLELDEDGRAFDPQYPAGSSVEKGPDGYKLTVTYDITHDTDCVLVVKNSNPDNAQQLSLSVSLKPSISLQRILNRIPVVRNLFKSDHDDMEE